MKPEVILESHSVLGEGPWWDAGAQKLYWIDGLTENGRGDWLHRYDPATGENETWEIGRHIGCALTTEKWTPGDGFGSGPCP